MRTRWIAASLLALSLTGAGCLGPGGEDGLDGEEVDIGTEEIRSVGSPPWIYDGPLPALTNPRIVISLAGHTMRVTGELPAGFSTPLPYWASEETVGGKRILTVVYPIATGASANLDTPGQFYSVTATPFRPNGMAYPRSGPTFVNWGGFPFMAYNGGVAFHGPITYTADGTENGERVYDWYLQRGPVSHGCNRMQGEHVVELAQLLGVNMRNTWRSGEKVTRRVHITVSRNYDVLPSGETVDVEYPRWRGATAPTGRVRMFRTWDGEEMARVVCADNRATRTAGRAVEPGFCSYMPENLRDLVTGNPTGPVSVDNRDGAFSVTGTWGTYTRSSVRVGSDYRGIDVGQTGVATWRLPVNAEGRIKLWARYAPDTNRNTHAIYRVFNDASATSGNPEVSVNQRLPGANGWVELGTYTLRAGARVTLTDRTAMGPAGDGWTLADAIRVEPVR